MYTGFGFGNFSPSGSNRFTMAFKTISQPRIKHGSKKTTEANKGNEGGSKTPSATLSVLTPVLRWKARFPKVKTPFQGRSHRKN
jgi:hypothetical protein